MTEPPNPFEVYLNEQRADLELFRLILQIWFSRLLDMMDNPRNGLEAMESEIEMILGQPIEPHREASDTDRFSTDAKNAS